MKNFLMRKLSVGLDFCQIREATGVQSRTDSTISVFFEPIPRLMYTMFSRIFATKRSS